MTTLKKTYFYRFFGSFPFLLFIFLFPFLQHKKKKQKMQFSFQYLIFDNPKFCKNTILTHCDTICVSKNAPKHSKTGENSKKTWTSF